MSQFALTTAFRLIRGLALQQFGTSMYLLISDANSMPSVEEDLKGEILAQLGIASEIEVAPAEMSADSSSKTLRIFRISDQSPAVIAFLDTHVVRLETLDSQLLFLTTEELSEELLSKAPNFRSRLADIMHLVPEDFA